MPYPSARLISYIIVVNNLVFTRYLSFEECLLEQGTLF